MKKIYQLTKTDNNSISQTSREIYKDILKKLNAYHKADARKLVYHLHNERHMSYDGIGHILGMTREAVRQKYFDEEVKQ